MDSGCARNRESNCGISVTLWLENTRIQHIVLNLVRLAGLEPATSCSGGTRTFSIRFLHCFPFPSLTPVGAHHRELVAAHARFVEGAEHEILLHSGGRPVAPVELLVVGGKTGHVLPVVPEQAEDVIVGGARVVGVPRHNATLRVGVNIVEDQALAISHLGRLGSRHPTESVDQGQTSESFPEFSLTLEIDFDL